MSDTLILPNLSEATFRRYEPFITKAVNAWPVETKFTVGDMIIDGTRVSPHTFAARLRDAITSVKKFNWEPTTVDVKKLWTLAGITAVAYDSDGVWFRAKGRKGRPTDMIDVARAQGVSAGADVNRAPWANVSSPEIHAVCVLIHHSRLTGPIIIPGKVDPELVDNLEKAFNVSLVYDSGNDKTVIN